MKAEEFLRGRQDRAGNAAVVNIRPERSDDAAAIRSILIAAFAGSAEADLVERLRRDGDLVLALAADDGEVRGYVAFPRLRVEHADGARDVVGLAPVAVAPDRQRRGIGSALIREGHRRLVARGESLIFVLGYPAYYTRFGYSLAAAAPFAFRPMRDRISWRCG